MPAWTGLTGLNDLIAEPDPVARALLARSETGLIAIDGGGQVRLANGAAMSLLGADHDDAGHTMVELLAAATALAPSAPQAFHSWLLNGNRGSLSLPRVDGRSIALTASPGPGEHRLLTLTFDSRNAIAPGRRDPLTGLADRAWFLDRLATMLDDGAPSVAVLMIDLDRFKAVNDTLGHPVGDALLQLVAKRLCGTLREADIVCRYAGDEFAVAIPHVSNPVSVGNRLVSVLSRPYLIEGATACIGASIGVALAPDHGNDVAKLIRSADIALYAAKADGRGITRVFDADLDFAARKRHAMAEALRRAVSHDQLELHYQPQMCLSSRTLTGFEALVRWNHPEFGQLGPNEFIPLAEETGLIWQIGDWVLRHACEQATNWPSNLTVAVNISPKQLRDRNRLARTVKSTLLRTALAPHRLEIEITEAALVREEETLPVLKAVRALGVRVSLDDFGTGCSSLSQLRRFPLDKIKIDRTFIQTLGTTEEATSLVRAIAALGHSMGITTIAEGVETEEQQARLQSAGCVEIQGFLLSKPVPAREIAGLIRSLNVTSANPALESRLAAD